MHAGETDRRLPSFFVCEREGNMEPAAPVDSARQNAAVVELPPPPFLSC